MSAKINLLSKLAPAIQTALALLRIALHPLGETGVIAVVVYCSNPGMRERLKESLQDDLQAMQASGPLAIPSAEIFATLDLLAAECVANQELSDYLNKEFIETAAREMVVADMLHNNL